MTTTNHKDLDWKLIQRVKKGEHRAFELLVRKYQGRMASVISRIVFSPEKVEDLVQETFIKAYRAIDSFRGDSAFYTWLFRISVNTAKNHLASLGRSLPLSDMEIEEVLNIGAAPQLKDDKTPEHAFLNHELMERLHHAIENLTPHLKKAIELREIKGLSYEEITEIMGCPIGTVRSRIFRAREEISEQLKPYLGGAA